MLQLAHVQALDNPSPQSFLEEKLLHDKWNFLRLIEESYFRQKSRINWLQEGDLNTTYFHQVCQARACFNAIRSFLLDLGVAITDPMEMSIHAVGHFKSVLGPEFLPPATLRSYPAWFSGLCRFSCSLQQQTAMLALPTSDEITKRFFKLNPNKAPGPDGLTSGFYKASWSFIGDEVINSIHHFFYSAFLPSTTNSTILALVPKFTGASRIVDYRPITCLNTIYKVISRLLVARLKPILSDLIVPNQTAFVKGRLLLENTVLASELVHGYHRDKGKKKVTLKVDISKAFDTLSWDFLFSCLEGLNLPPLYISWLRACICTTNFTLGYNGTVNGYFKGRRGLRQGDPLSPYLFVIAMNCLSLMLNRMVSERNREYHHNCRKIKLTHLSFADDLLIFIEGSIDSVQSVLQVLHEFELRSGLAVSYQKTSFFASGLSDPEIAAIQVSTGMKCGSLPVKYLGVPLCTKKLTLANCEPLLQQVKARFASWSAKALSFAGRLLLIKTVISGITTFWCSSFILPKACVNKINSLCGLFLWTGKSEGHHSARVAWDTVTLTKEQGGLGVKDLLIWNRACSLKLVWLLFFRPSSVWAAYFKEVILKGNFSNFWTIKVSTSHSWLVNKLIKTRDLCYPLIKRRLGNGNSTSFWFDNWSPYGNLNSFLNGEVSRLGIRKTATVASLFTNGSWLLPPARTENQLAVQIHLTTISLIDCEDTFEWEINGIISDNFSTGSVYTYLKGEVPTVAWSSVVWSSYGIPRHNFLAWLVVLNRCPTRDRLIGWGLQVDPLCPLCNALPESRNHLFFECVFSFQIWSAMASRCGLHARPNWDETLIQLQIAGRNKNLQKLLLLAWKAAIYYTWRERNQRIHQQTFQSVDTIISQLDRQLRNQIQSFRQIRPRQSSLLMQFWLTNG